MKEIKKWFNILRPKTLFASFVPVVVGVCYALLTTSIDYFVAMVTLFCGVSLQTLSNLINDYYDYKRGTDQKDRIGFKRALAQGEISIQQMKKAIYLNLSFSLLCGIYLVYIGGLPIVIIGVLSVLFAWLYTATPYSLSYLGIADIFAFLFYGPIATCGTYYLLCSDMVLIKRVVAAGCVCGCVSTMILTVNNLRDIDTDKTHGKKSFEVRFGKTAGEIKYLIFALFISVFSFFSLFRLNCNGSFIIILPVIMLFAGVSLFSKLKKAKGQTYNKLLFHTSLLNILYLLLLVITLFV